MRRFVGVFVALMGSLCGLAFAQVTDRPITSMPQAWTGVVVDVTPSPLQACIAGWERSSDRFADYGLRAAFLDCGRLTAAQCSALATAAAAGDLAAMTALRTTNVAGDPAMKPCIDKLKAPPLRWVVAPIASGQRPAYLLNTDKTRGKQSGYADTTIAGQPMWCNCKTRSVEPTGSTYCTWATARQTFDPAEPMRVALCREPR